MSFSQKTNSIIFLVSLNFRIFLFFLADIELNYFSHRERRMIILNAKRRRIFREKQRVVEAGWAEVLDENARKSLRQQLENEIYLILILLIEFCLVLWTIVWNDL